MYIPIIKISILIIKILFQVMLRIHICQPDKDVMMMMKVCKINNL